MPATMVELIVGTFGSGKTTALAEAALAFAGRALIIVPTKQHAADMRALLGPDAKRLEIVPATQLQLTLDDVYLGLFEGIFLDDLDAMVESICTMQAAGKRVLELAAQNMLVKVVGTARRAVAGWPAPTRELRFSWRMAANKHAPLLEAMFRTHDVRPDTPAIRVYASVPASPAEQTQQLADDVWGCLMMSAWSGDPSGKTSGETTRGKTAVLCNNENVLRRVGELLPRMNGVRVRQCIPPFVQHQAPCSAGAPLLELSTIRNFYGRECMSTVLVLDPQDTLADLVEGMTRHTQSLALVFVASAPPGALCPCAPVLSQWLPPSVYVNWAPREPAIAAKKLAADVSRDLTDPKEALARLAQRFAQEQHAGKTWSVVDRCPARLPIPVPGRVDYAKLGTVVEHLTAVVAGFPAPQELAHALGRANMLDAFLADVKQGGWMSLDVERALWLCAGMPPEQQVSHLYFSAVRARLQEMLGLLPSRPTAYQVPVKLELSDGTHVTGTADFVGADYVLEIKHITDNTLVNAVVQTAVYMLALDKKHGFVFNARTRHLMAVSCGEQAFLLGKY
jgi:hypothetical protein